MQPREKHYKEYMGLQCNLQGPQKKATFAKMAWGWNALGTILEMLGLFYNLGSGGVLFKESYVQRIYFFRGVLFGA